jgi:hypothetical protein
MDTVTANLVMNIYVCTLAVASLMRTVRTSSEAATSLRFEKDDILLIVQITWQGLQKVS